MQHREIRLLTGLSVEERAKGDASAPMIVGYAAVFDTETDIGGMFCEKIAKGAFGDALKTSDVHALFNHDEDYVLGRMKAGTLRLAEDDYGLRVEIDPPDTQDARDLIVNMKRGDIDQMSFAFTMLGGVQTWDDTVDPPFRTIEKVGELYDVSVVTRGAYPTTEAAVRSLEESRKSKNFHAASVRIRRKMHLEQKLRRTAR